MNLDFLKQRRRENGKTQEEVADALGMRKQSYSKIESGENNLHPRHWKKIETLLGVTRSELCDFTATVAVTRRQKLEAEGKVHPLFPEVEVQPQLPKDPFLKIVVENWFKLTFEQRGRIAGLIASMAEQQQAPIEAAPVTAICPKCGEKITEPHNSGDRFECPKCGQHLRAK